MARIRLLKLLVPIPLLACGTEDRASETPAGSDATVQVVIAAPLDGASVTAPVTIELEARNLTIRPAGTDEPNTGHHHLFINRDIVPEGELIETGPGIIHLGAGQLEYVIEEPGTYTAIAVLGDHQHIRIPGAKTDSVRFTVQ